MRLIITAGGDYLAIAGIIFVASIIVYSYFFLVFSSRAAKIEEHSLFISLLLVISSAWPLLPFITLVLGIVLCIGYLLNYIKTKLMRS